MLALELWDERVESAPNPWARRRFSAWCVPGPAEAPPDDGEQWPLHQDVLVSRWRFELKSCSELVCRIGRKITQRGLTHLLVIWSSHRNDAWEGAGAQPGTIPGGHKPPYGPPRATAWWLVYTAAAWVTLSARRGLKEDRGDTCKLPSAPLCFQNSQRQLQYK